MSKPVNGPPRSAARFPSRGMPADRRSWIRGIPMAWRRLVARTVAPRRRRRCARRACAGLWRHGGGGRRVVRHPARLRACAAGRERRGQVHHRQAAVGAGRAQRGTAVGARQPGRAALAARGARAGIQTAFQEMTLVPDLSVLDNMLLPYAPQGPLGMIARRRGGTRGRASARPGVRGGPAGRGRRAGAGAAPEGRDRAGAVAPAAHPAAGRAHVHAGRARRGLAGRHHRASQAPGRDRGVHLASHARGARVLRPPDHPAQRQAHIHRSGRCIERRRGDRAHYRPQPVAGVSAARGTADRDAAAGAGGARAGRRRARAWTSCCGGRDPGRGRPAGHGPAGPVQRLLRHDAATGGPDPGGRARGRAGFARRRDQAEHRHRHGARGSQDRGSVPEAGWPRQRRCRWPRASRAAAC